MINTGLIQSTENIHWILGRAQDVVQMWYNIKEIQLSYK